MKTATVRELRNHYADLLKRVAVGEEIEIVRRGKPVALLTAPRPAPGTKVDWTQSAALRRDKSQWPRLSAQASAALLAEAQGRY